ncbi:EAL-associated domain-containing protein [Metabacillus arenae]|uniref:EAL domain-containing protein n=1 Tax=Metabacillus arenae TaxID=2771434 RepID=A0A926RY22_9BACI|nr:EAL-associated domain-containing protein [Metabacillus arenae]MBD1381275.1 EAL domain-containing protein [Metabacillus arenae]
MDPLDIMSNLDKVHPFYQAIFSADEQKVIGFEILGRTTLNGEVESLGPFFHDPGIPEDYKIEVDDLILSKGLNFLLKNTDESVLIFLNRDADLLMLDHGESFFQLLSEFEQNGLNLSRIVLEITEHNFRGDLDQLYHLLVYYRTYGIKVAVDNIGKDSSNLDRIGLLSPDILKIDLHPLRMTSPSQSYHDVLYSISLLARKIGATLLYEDIEVNFQLQYAWKNGGRYFQGFYLHEPSPELIHNDALKDRLEGEFHQFITHEKRKLELFYKRSEQFNQKVLQSLRNNKQVSDFNELIVQLAEKLTDCCFRVYICNEEGVQQTGNIFKNEDNWVFQPEYYLKNWSWRPYFLENIIRMRNDKKGFFSDLYSDIETGEVIRTFSYPIDEKHYLFIDLPYSYLYEQDGLL